ncbi:DNA-directed RNA polymerase- subunit M- archaeal [Striga hermonthica]|uniref:DNA-directed RNA polymerase- subunit M- archaeal n=1 Tax=Striga hermonthica TaxID=68872 RepID=A0A9N7N579_STRHE|nr:DNA-directed RNA polymerase- subunit M- archaeal [Striga hermonthica]
MLLFELAYMAHPNQFFCPTCPYICRVENKIKQHMPLVRKPMEPIFSEDDQKVINKTSGVSCPACGHGEASFIEVQTSAPDGSGHLRKGMMASPGTDQRSQRSRVRSHAPSVPLPARTHVERPNAPGAPANKIKREPHHPAAYLVQLCAEKTRDLAVNPWRPVYQFQPSKPYIIF